MNFYIEYGTEELNNTVEQAEGGQRPKNIHDFPGMGTRRQLYRATEDRITLTILITSTPDIGQSTNKREK